MFETFIRFIKKYKIYKIYKLFKIFKIYKIYNIYKIYKIYKIYRIYKMQDLAELMCANLFCCCRPEEGGSSSGLHRVLCPLPTLVTKLMTMKIMIKTQMTAIMSRGFWKKASPLASPVPQCRPLR